MSRNLTVLLCLACGVAVYAGMFTWMVRDSERTRKRECAAWLGIQHTYEDTLKAVFTDQRRGCVDFVHLR